MSRMGWNAVSPWKVVAFENSGPSWQASQCALPVKTLSPATASADMVPISNGDWSEIRVRSYASIAMPKNIEKSGSSMR